MRAFLKFYEDFVHYNSVKLFQYWKLKNEIHLRNRISIHYVQDVNNSFLI